MRIKISQSKLNDSPIQKQNKLIQSNKNSVDQSKSIVFQSQMNSLQNCFSLLHHITGKKSQIKKVIKNVTTHKNPQKLFELQIKDIKKQGQFDPDLSIRTKSLLKQKQFSPKKSSLTFTKTEMSRPKWKQNILRRKNNGSYGQILKGNPKTKYGLLINRFCSSQCSYIDQPPKIVDKLEKQTFIPLGDRFLDCSKNNIQFKSEEQETQEDKNHLKRTLKGRKKSSNSIKRHIASSQSKKNGHSNQQQNQMIRACTPLKFISDTKQITISMRKTIISTPYRYKSRLSTPCPWDYTSQR